MIKKPNINIKLMLILFLISCFSINFKLLRIGVFVGKGVHGTDELSLPSKPEQTNLLREALSKKDTEVPIIEWVVEKAPSAKESVEGPSNMAKEPVQLASKPETPVTEPSLNQKTDCKPSTELAIQKAPSVKESVEESSNMAKEPVQLASKPETSVTKPSLDQKTDCKPSTELAIQKAPSAKESVGESSSVAKEPVQLASKPETPVTEPSLDQKTDCKPPTELAIEKAPSAKESVEEPSQAAEKVSESCPYLPVSAISQGSDCAFPVESCFDRNLHPNFCPWPKRIYISHVDGTNNGIAFASNYSTLGIVFAPDYCPGSVLPMLDVRVHRFDNPAYGFNAGLIARYVPNPSSGVSNFCQVLGVNAYYDYREGFIGYYQQLGSGLEVIGSRWDFRSNIYFPIGPKRNVKTCVFDDYIGDYIIIKNAYESVSFAFNAEVGYYFVNTCSFFLYGAAGPYYIAGRKCHSKTRGGKARIRPQYKDYIALDLSVSYDPLFQTVWQAELIFSLPLYQLSYSKSSKGPCGISNRQIYQPVERFEVMPLGRRDCWTTNY